MLDIYMPYQQQTNGKTCALRDIRNLHLKKKFSFDQV